MWIIEEPLFCLLTPQRGKYSISQQKKKREREWEIGIYSYIRILYNNENEQSPMTCFNVMNESHKHHVERKKPET